MPAGRTSSRRSLPGGPFCPGRTAGHAADRQTERDLPPARTRRRRQRRWSLLSQLLEVLGLNGLEQAVGRLLAADELLKLWRPTLGEDRAGRVGDEVHGAIRLGDVSAG